MMKLKIVLLLLLVFGHSGYSCIAIFGVPTHVTEEKKTTPFTFNSKYEDKHNLIRDKETQNWDKEGLWTPPEDDSYQSWDRKGLWKSSEVDSYLAFEPEYENKAETHNVTDTTTEILYEKRIAIGNLADSIAKGNQISFEIPENIIWNKTICMRFYSTEKHKTIEWQCSVSSTNNDVRFSITEEKTDSSFATVVADTVDNYTYRNAENMGKKYFLNLKYDETNTKGTVSVKISIKREISTNSLLVKKIYVGQRPVRIKRTSFSDAYHTSQQQSTPAKEQDCGCN